MKADDIEITPVAFERTTEELELITYDGTFVQRVTALRILPPIEVVILGENRVFRRLQGKVFQECMAVQAVEEE